MTRVSAPCRLHFGLLSVPVSTPTSSSESGAQPNRRAFGGVGLMIDRPGLSVTVSNSESWTFEGPLANRAQLFAQRFLATVPEVSHRPLRVHVERCPPEHTGLGVGTQLGLAVAHGIAAELGIGDLSAVELATRIGRGERSAIGIHGFEGGGLIVEPGKLEGEAVAPLLVRMQLPSEWRIVLLIPSDVPAWHGAREREAFERMSHERIEALTDSLCRIALRELVPSAMSGDLDRFGEAVHSFNRRAGEPFADVQGGPYSSGEVGALIAAVRSWGVKGVGQSSWGPAVFAVVGSEEEAELLVAQVPPRFGTVLARTSVGSITTWGK